MELNPGYLYASQYSELIINVFPVNTLGFHTPFSKAEVRFDIVDGSNLIELANTEENHTAKIKSKGKEGEAVIGVYSLKSGLELYKILIKILPKDVA